jgi:hypothetical protein
VSYKRTRKVLKLVYEDEPGLVIMARSLSIRNMITVLKLAELTEGIGEEMTPAQVERLVGEVLPELFGWFVKRVESWTWEDDDGPVPVTVDALMDDDDFTFGIKLVMGWVQAMTSVAVPLVTTSGASTAPPEEAELDLPMSPPTPG